MKTHELDIIEDPDTGQKTVSLTPIRQLWLQGQKDGWWGVETEAGRELTLGILATVDAGVMGETSLFLHIELGWFYSSFYSLAFIYLCPVCPLKAAKAALLEQM